MDATARALTAQSGEQLRKLRCQKGLTQADVAYAVGLTQATLSNYELGKRPMLLITAVALAQYFNVSLETLIEGTPVPAPTHDRITELRRSTTHHRPIALARR